MRKLLLCAILLIFSHFNFAQDVTALTNFAGKVKVSIVDITKAWNQTGIQVDAGDTVFIFVEGLAATNSSNYEILWIGPEGMGGPDWIGGSGVPVPGAASHSVVGKIGDAGTPFYVGSKCSFTANAAGELQLGYNDFGLGDNYGYYVAFISKSKNLITVEANDRMDPNIVDFSLSQNYPNPFNPSTKINFSVPGASNVNVKVYDINGQIVKNLLSEFKSSGSYSISWDGKNDTGVDVSSGTYFYEVQVGSFVQTKKMVLLK